MKFVHKLTSCVLALLLSLSLALPGLAAEAELSMLQRPRESESAYTLGDLAASRLAVYGILDSDFRIPQERTKEPLSRIEAVTLLWKAFGNEETSETKLPFTDVEEQDISAVSWAYHSGIASGIAPRTFGNGEMTEQQFAAMLLYAMGHRGRFPYAQALTYAKALGLSPLGLSGAFTLGDAALYLQCALDLPDSSGAPLRERLKLPESLRQTTFPGTVLLSPPSQEETKPLLELATRYLPWRIKITADFLSTEDLYRMYHQYREDYERFTSRDGQTEQWYESRIQTLTTLTPSLQLRPDASGNSLAFYVSYNEAWKLVCDLDDAFAYNGPRISDQGSKKEREHGMMKQR